MGGFGGYFSNQYQQQQQAMPPNLQAQDVPPGTGGVKSAPGSNPYVTGDGNTYNPYQNYGSRIIGPPGQAIPNQSFNPAAPGYRPPQQPFGGPMRGSWPGQGYGGLPGRYGGSRYGGYPAGGYGGAYGGGGYGNQGFSRGNMYGPGSYPPRSAGMMGYGGGSGMMTPFGAGPGGFSQLISGLMGGMPQTQYAAYQPLSPYKPPPPPPKPARTTRIGGGEGGGRGDGPGDGPGSGPSGGDGSGCFAKGTLFEMADGEFKAIEDIEVGDKMRGGIVLRTRSGPSTNEWYDFHGTDVTDEHFAFEAGVWRYVKDTADAFKIPPKAMYYTLDNTEHRLYGVNGTIFTDDAVFDEDHPLHELPYEKATWDLMLVELNDERSHAA